MAFQLAKSTRRRFAGTALSCQSAWEAQKSKAHQGAPTRSFDHFPSWERFQQCQFYSRPRGPLWRGRKGIGKEALYVLGEVKRHKNDSVSLGNTFRAKVARLLKVDLLAVLQELQRQSEVDLALRVFETVRKEVWYRPDIYFYKDMLHSLAKARRVGDCERLLKNLKAEGLPPDGLLLTEVMTAYLECGLLPQAMETFDEMRQGSVPPDLPAFKVLLRFLKKMGKVELRKKIRAECLEFYEGIVESKHKKRREESEDEEGEMDSERYGKANGDEEFELGHKESTLDEESDEELEMKGNQSATDGELDEDSFDATYEDSDGDEMENRRSSDSEFMESGDEEMTMMRRRSAKFEESDKEEEF